MRRLSSCTLLVGTTAVLTALAIAAPAAGYNATVRQTQYGIPHVKAKNWGSAGFGVGYAFAKDDLCTFANDVITLRARRSKYFGPDGSTPASATSPVNNVDSDLYWQSIIDSHRVEHLLSKNAPQRPSKAARRGIAGYAAGYDAYLKKVGVNSLPDSRCRGADWVKPIRPIDVWRRIYQADILASSQNFISMIVHSAPPGSNGAGTQLSPAETKRALERSSLDQDQAGADAATEPLGSNALGLGSKDTRSGDGMVLGNPHFPWRGTERFWDFQLTVPGKVNVEGASLMGFPAINIGHNRHVAWSHTVSTAQRFTFFQLQLDPNDPTSYIYDGRSIPMTHRAVEIPLRGGGTASTTIWYTRFGPVISDPNIGLPWSSSTAIALGDANDHIRSADTFIAMDRAKSGADLIGAETKYAGVPWVNTIGADDTGTAFYADNSVVPNVTQAKMDACIKPGLSQLIYLSTGIISLDGSTSACNWGNDPDASVNGIFGPSNLPIDFRRDYVLNANDSYWQTNAQHPLTGYAPIIGCEDCEQGLRTRLGHEMVAQRMAATDGLSPKPGFTLGNLQRMWLGDRSLAAELAKNALHQICVDNPQIDIGGGTMVNVTKACPIIAAYNETGKLDSPGGWLFNLWWSQTGGAGFWKDSFDPSQPLTTPHVVDTTNPDSIRTLGVAVKQMRDRGIPLKASYGDVQYAATRHGRIPIHGCNTGCWQDIESPIDDSSAVPYGQAFYGSSTVQFTKLTKHGPKGDWLLTYSQSDRPGSRHHSDQTRLFSKSKFVPMRFTDKQIKADPHLRVYRVHAKRGR